MAIIEKKKGSNTAAATISSVISFHFCTPIRFCLNRYYIQYIYVRAIDHIVPTSLHSSTCVRTFAIGENFDFPKSIEAQAHFQIYYTFSVQGSSRNFNVYDVPRTRVFDEYMRTIFNLYEHSQVDH